MAKSKRSGAAHKAYYARYKTGNLHDKNAKRRLERALKKNPENEQIKVALNNIHRTRKTPKTPFWNPTRRREAELYKLFTGRVNVDIFSNNDKVSFPAMMTPGHKSVKVLPKKNEKLDKRSMFSIGVRVDWE